MTTTIRSNADGSKSYIQVGGTDRVTIDAATGNLTSTYSPPTGERSLALATMQKFADEFGASLAGAGYQKLPGGLIIQWGVIPSTAANTSVTVTYPVAFTTAIAQVVPATSGTVATDIFENVSATGSQATFRNTSGGTAQSGSYIAIGY